jgi:hypothetical protein
MLLGCRLEFEIDAIEDPIQFRSKLHMPIELELYSDFN